MEKLKIIGIDGFKYYLKDTQNNDRYLNLEFHDLENKPKISDFIFINEKLINNKVLLSFGKLDSIYGKKTLNSKDEDIIILQNSNGNFYLKRLYG